MIFGKPINVRALKLLQNVGNAKLDVSKQVLLAEVKLDFLYLNHVDCAVNYQRRSIHLLELACKLDCPLVLSVVEQELNAFYQNNLKLDKVNFGIRILQFVVALQDLKDVLDQRSVVDFEHIFSLF